MDKAVWEPIAEGLGRAAASADVPGGIQKALQAAKARPPQGDSNAQ